MPNPLLTLADFQASASTPDDFRMDSESLIEAVLQGKYAGRVEERPTGEASLLVDGFLVIFDDTPDGDASGGDVRPVPGAPQAAITWEQVDPNSSPATGGTYIARSVATNEPIVRLVWERERMGRNGVELLSNFHQMSIWVFKGNLRTALAAERAAALDAAIPKVSAKPPRRL